MSPSLKPLIGLTMDDELRQSNGKSAMKANWLKRSYAEAVIAAGGVPLALPTNLAADIQDIYVNLISGLIIIGGDFDVPPHFYGQKNEGKVRQLNEERSAFEKAMIDRAWARRMPMLGICGGAQLLNVCRGGTLHQHVDAHEGCEHGIAVNENSVLKTLLGQNQATVNSTHHQVIDRVGDGLVVCASAPDGCIEAVEHVSGGFFCVGTQWHPESLIQKFPEQCGIFRGLIQAASGYMAVSDGQ